MTRHDRTRRLERALERHVRLGAQLDARLASAGEALAKAEAAFRKLGEPR